MLSFISRAWSLQHRCLSSRRETCPSLWSAWQSVWGTAFLPCVQTDWSAPCCPISRIAVLSLRLPSASFEGKGPNPECRFMGLGELPGFLWSREHDSPVISSLFQSEVLQAPSPPHRTPNPCNRDAQPVCNQRCSLSFQWE